MARLIAAPDQQAAIQLVNRVAALSQGELEPDDFLKQLRVMELAIEQRITATAGLAGDRRLAGEAVPLR